MLSASRAGVRLACLALSVTPGVAAAAVVAPAQVRVNGVPFALQLRVMDGEPGVLARRLEGRWGERLVASAAQAATATAGGAPPAHAAPREVLGRQRGPFHETLTLRVGPRPGTSYVLVAVQDLRRPPQPLPRAPLPLPGGAQMLTVVQFGDAPGASALFSAASRESPRSVVERMAEAARSGGWRVAFMPRSDASAGAGFQARRGARELTVVATPVGTGARLQLLALAGPRERPW